jgi:hypothetical protein
MDRMYDDFHGLWRSSAMEKHPYTEDFPEPLLVSPELYDGSIGHGKASNIWIDYDFTKTPAQTRVRDDGQGVRNETRLLTWAASTSQSTEHRNGHGHKKAMTKFAPNYETAKWSIQYRKPGGNLIVLKGPFLGNRTLKIEDEENTTTLMPSGTETCIEFDKTVLGRFAEPTTLAEGLKELIRSRYSESILARVTFHIDIHSLNAKGEHVHTKMNSRTENWHSFRWHVEAGVAAGYIRALCVNQARTSAEAPWNLSVYKITPKGTQNFALKDEFPTYGKKNQSAQRAYIALQDRMIEAAHLYPFLDRQSPHNDHNGLIVFADFTSPELAKQLTPSTTKVSIFPSGEIYKQFDADLKACLKNILAAPAETDESSGSEASPVRPTPVARVERAVLVATDLGVSFHMKNGQMFVDFNDGTGMKLLRNYALKPKPSTASSTA